MFICKVTSNFRYHVPRKRRLENVKSFWENSSLTLISNNTNNHNDNNHYNNVDNNNDNNINNNNNNDDVNNHNNNNNNNNNDNNLFEDHYTESWCSYNGKGTKEKLQIVTSYINCCNLLGRFFLYRFNRGQVINMD